MEEEWIGEQLGNVLIIAAKEMDNIVDVILLIFAAPEDFQWGHLLEDKNN